MTDDRTELSGRDVDAESLEDWRLLFSTLHGRFETGDFATGLELVAAIGEAAAEMDHHPDLELTPGRVDVRLTSHDVGGVTRRDVRLARAISSAAGRLAATPRPEQTAVLELALDTEDFEEIKPFWAALLGYESDEEAADELNDPDGRMPTIWFQETDAHETPRQRWHLDLRLPPEMAEQRIEHALAAGGTMVYDGAAPAFWTLADPQGNRSCITTRLGRGDDGAGSAAVG